MAKKKSVKRAARTFVALLDELDQYYMSVQAAPLTKQQTTWAVEASLIKLSAGFERMLLEALVGAINNDTSTLSARTGIDFPKHLTDEVCEYLVIGSGYFDFRGREGLIKTLKDFLPDSHYLVVAVKKTQFRVPLERLIALRNFAAHESPQSKRNARDAVGRRLSAAGAWLKVQNRFLDITAPLRVLANEIEAGAPY
jgi:hypothetical protein